MTTADYGYVTVHETKDPAQGEVLAELLRNEGIAARFRGPATTLVGVLQHVVAMAVEVPVESEARARQFLRDLEDATGAADGSSEE
jgi:Lhr-like helicase